MLVSVAARESRRRDVADVVFCGDGPPPSPKRGRNHTLALPQVAPLRKQANRFPLSQPLSYSNHNHRQKTGASKSTAWKPRPRNNAMDECSNLEHFDTKFGMVPPACPPASVVSGSSVSPPSESRKTPTPQTHTHTPPFMPPVRASPGMNA